MDEWYFRSDKKRRRKRVSHDESGELFPENHPENTKRGATAPHQPSSETSREAAESIAPKMEDHKAICFRAILHATRTGDGITRKEIAFQYFDKQQDYVTGRIAELIEAKLIYEKPARVKGIILRDNDGKIIREKRDGSVILLAKRNDNDGEE